MKNRPFFWVIGVLFILLAPLAEAKQSQSELQDKLDAIQANLKDKQAVQDDLQSKIDIYEQNLKAKREEALTLNSEIEVLDQNIELTKAEINQTEVEIESLGLEIEGLDIEVNQTEDGITDKKDQMSTLIRDLYDYDQATYLEIALTNATLSQFSTQVEYTETVNNEFKESVEALKELKAQLQEQKQELDEKKSDQIEKKTELEVRQESLNGEVGFKQNLLSSVQEDETKFQQLVQDIRAEQNQYNAEISSLEKSARATLDKLNDSTTTDPGNSGITDPLPSDFDPIWPVTGPVTTLFHDPNYYYKSYFEHDAIDIAAPQGTPLKAADGGVVAIVKFDGSSSYSYVMIIHANNYATLYGHVNAVYVQPDQVVQKGQIIAAVGGIPGTTGAGPFTTGAHVHFGVRLNGIPVDPLLYLP